ncbi:Cytochrome P450 monooxygenase [Rhizoctonia solani]|uniref:Cytochrome P450 monooxygenase n=1 Tax=Rhizoctonia solani TaxID=456999 RepID=A0A8H7LI91_9AGAM|nr:Cytochrome P450 monooxygenase [Rhizoctonia solani]
MLAFLTRMLLKYIVYGHGLLKSEFYHAFKHGPSNDIFNTPDKVEHSKKRKRLANIFSAQSVFAFEPRVREHIRQLCAQWDLRCRESACGVSGDNWSANDGKAVIDLCAQISYLAFDIIGDLALGSCFGLIQAQKDSSLSIESVNAFGDPQRGTIEIPVVKTIVRGGVSMMGIGVFPAWTHRFLQYFPWNLVGLFDSLNFFKLATTSVHGRIKRGPKEVIQDGKRSIDIMEKLLEVEEDGRPLPTHELTAEAIVLLIAGSDTISSTLGCLFYHLATNPRVQRELQIELDQHIPFQTSSEPHGKEGLDIRLHDTVVRYDDVKALPYLEACIKEALRLQSPTATGLPRVVPPGNGVIVSGEPFKPGSIISVPLYTIHHSSVWGSDAADFRPEQWLDDKCGLLSKYFQPFSLGPRTWIGRNFAYMNLMLSAATLARRYKIEALHTTKPMTYEGFLRSTISCEVMIKRRKV